MKLTNEDKDLLLEWGHSETDLEQIEQATTKTDYSVNYEEKITIEKAIDLLGRREFLSGLSRSAFHWSASRQIGNSENVVTFDSSESFK